MRSARAARGFSLIVTMAVVAVITLLVAGAIAFAGRERAAAGIHTESEDLSSCAQAARDAFLARVHLLRFDGQPPVPTRFTDGFDYQSDGGAALQVMSGHYGGSVAIQSVTQVPAGRVGAAVSYASDLSATVGSPSSGVHWWKVVATCHDSRPGGGQMETEFVVQLGF